MKRGHVKHLAALALAIALAPSVWAGAILERIASSNLVTIGFSDRSAPFSFVRDGQVQGYSLDLCREVATRIGARLDKPFLRSTFARVPQDQMTRYVSDGTVQLICGGVSDTQKRREVMMFSSPIFLSSVKFLVRADGARNAAALDKGTVAVINRTTAEEAVRNFATGRRLDLKVAVADSADAALTQLRLSQASAWARDEVLLLGSIANSIDAAAFRILPDALSTEVLAIGMPPDKELHEIVQDTLRELARSGRLDEIYERWFVRPNVLNPKGLGLPVSAELKAAFDALR